MEDMAIVALYWKRSERAISESDAKYGAYCHSIANNILGNPSDAEECVNDTWLRAWNAMPPLRPAILRSFLGKITRNLSFDLYRRTRRQKRGAGQIELVLDELEELVSGRDDPLDEVLKAELASEIDSYLLALSEEKQRMFILRYWYAESVSDIASRLGMSENNVSVSLSRIRNKLREHLSRRGYAL